MMKKCNVLLLIPALVFFPLVLSAQATTTHEITLRVDTANFNQQDPAASCEFVAGEGTEVLIAGPAQEFTIAAEVGDTIRWNGTSSTEPDVSVEIKKIKYERGVNLFPASEMDGTDIVEGTIIKGNRGDDFKYNIMFKIGGTGAVHKIDPKIQVK